MFLTSILKIFNSLYVSFTFQFKIGCLSVHQITLNSANTVLLLLPEPSASLTSIIAALVASIPAYVIICFMLCLDAISFQLFFSYV